MVGIGVAIGGLNFAVKLCFETMNRLAGHHIPQNFVFNINGGNLLKEFAPLGANSLKG